MIAFDKNQIPFVTVIIAPTSDHPIVLTMNDDWRETGEYILSVTPLAALQIANDAMQMAAGFMADEVWEKLEARKRLKEGGCDDLPTS